MGEFRAMEGDVTELWAVIAEGEGVVAIAGAAGVPLPMVTYVPRVAELFRGRLVEIAQTTGKRVGLFKATNAELVVIAEP